MMTKLLTNHTAADERPVLHHATRLGLALREEARRRYATATWRTWAAVAAAVLIAYWLMPRRSPEPVPALLLSSALGGPPAVAEAARTVTFTVAGVGRSRDGRVAFLNDASDWRAAGTTVVLKGPAAGVNLDALRGRQVTVTGAAGSYRGRPQLTVTDAGQIAVK
jgi:hypothetical protein